MTPVVVSDSSGSPNSEDTLGFNLTVFLGIGEEFGTGQRAECAQCPDLVGRTRPPPPHKHKDLSCPSHTRGTWLLWVGAETHVCLHGQRSRKTQGPQATSQLVAQAWSRDAWYTGPTSVLACLNLTVGGGSEAEASPVKGPGLRSRLTLVICTHCSYEGDSQ